MVERGARHWPVEIRLKDRGHVLSVAFDDGRDFSLAAEYLRISSPSAEVQGHSPTERRIVAGKIDVAISEVIPVGNYAVRLVFDDRHQTGIFTWDYLYELGDRREANWTSYLSELAARKLQRES
ncbi:MAG: DUF971 domain-containing protein [Methylobacteriaceae bacterium]|nr:DUF971 domain-containing protein [Methylobacteriaceae bacterium]